jgi:hypothetical protein
MTDQGTPGRMIFFPPKSAPDRDLQLALPESVLFDGRRSRRGLIVTRFPVPFQDLEITQGERLGTRKWERVKKAVAYFERQATKGSA